VAVPGTCLLSRFSNPYYPKIQPIDYSQVSRWAAEYTRPMMETIRLRNLLVALAGWVNRHQLDIIDYLRTENRVLEEHLGRRRLRLTDAQRRRLAAKGHRLGRSTAKR
jgi:hypothetical protein